MIAPSAWAQGQERIPSHCIALANDIEGARVIPAAFGDPLSEGRVRLSYVDHATFLLETPGGLVAATDYTGYLGAHEVLPDVVTMNNAHSSHWTGVPDERIPHVLQGWGEGDGPADYNLDLGEMLVRNVTTDARGMGSGIRANANSIFIFEVAGLCIGHLGHLHQIPSPEQYAMIGRLDVVMVPVDGGYTMRTDAMAEVVKRLRSSVIIPMHWFSGSSLNQFLEDMNGEFEVVRPEISSMEISLNDLPSQPTIMVLLPEY
ncbi:MAG: Zn-dependent hydrolase [Cereibacter sphaeroides]|uniref:Zn-dependent hydrolase n=1 Tax=Cereibacter sphaeroides TaxID=1063 RepID=A0A2W5TW18_CERSP|nr:MAG: Zn-dependent hydrolase [Cereibacter sphaeroides]